MDPELRQRLKKLEVQALRLVNSRFLGEWTSNVKGQGLDFRDLREYVPGDDVRRLDWKATARSGKAQLRQFSEDRQQTLWLALDLSASMEGSKENLARQMLAALAWAAVKQGDRFGLLGFTKTVEIHKKPARGEVQLWAALEAVLNYKKQYAQTDFQALLDFFLKQSTHRSTIIILSDFQAELDIKTLKALSARHEVIAFHLLETRFDLNKTGGLVYFYDSETSETAWVDASSRSFQEKFQEAETLRKQRLKSLFGTSAAWYKEFSAEKDFVPDLLSFFHQRREVLGV